jgi:hypothetical protein
MSSYTVSKLLADALALRQRSPTLNLDGSQLNLEEVWSAVTNYVADCMERRRGLEIPRFCRIGWQLHRAKPEPIYAPYFVMVPLFSQINNIDESNTSIQAQKRHILPIEEFCFSKAAMRYSQTQSKKHMYAGLKLIIHCLTEAIVQGREVKIDMKVGTLFANERSVRFVFAPQFYREQGISVPATAASSSDYSSADYTRAPIVKAAQGLYTLGVLCDDVKRQVGLGHTGVCPSGLDVDIAEVWAIMDRYLTSCLVQKRGVHIAGFFRVGREVVRDKHAQPLPYPYFSLSGTFCQTYGVRQTGAGRGPLPDAELVPMENFNFTKAATQFSSAKVPYDQYALCFKLLVQQAGMVMGQGQKVCLDFTFGRLASANRKVSFAFSAQFLTANGFTPPHLVVHNLTPHISSSASTPNSWNLEAKEKQVHADSKHSQDVAAGWTDLASRVTTPRCMPTPRSNAISAAAQVCLQPGGNTPLLEASGLKLSCTSMGCPKPTTGLSLSGGHTPLRADPLCTSRPQS